MIFLLIVFRIKFLYISRANIQYSVDSLIIIIDILPI